MSDDPAARLFVYGTLQQREVQLAIYGRPLEGAPDALAGYHLEDLTISDPVVVRLSGKAVHRIARRSGEPTDQIAGVVLRLSDAELAATDAYEVAVYARVEASLESGTRAWVYVGPDLPRGAPVNS